MRALLALLLVLVLAAPALAEEPAATSGEFKDWHAACRADGHCAATAYVNRGAEPRVADYVLTIGRQAQQTYWEIQFSTLATHGDEWSDFIVTVDDHRTSFSLQPEVGAYGTPDDFFFLGDKAQEMMDNLMPGRNVTIAFTDTDQAPHSASFSLAGLTAALIWIDDQQNRIGSERVAAAAPYGLVPVSGGETEAPAIPQALLDRERGDPECQPFEQLANGRDFTVDELDGGYTLYVIPCWSAAYNFGWKVYLGGADEFTPQYFAAYDGTDYGWVGISTLANYEYDAETKTLMSLDKARGIGDCGAQGTWTWNGTIFRLEQYRYKDCTDDPIDENAELPEFPIVYTASPRP